MRIVGGFRANTQLKTDGDARSGKLYLLINDRHADQIAGNANTVLDGIGFDIMVAAETSCFIAHMLSCIGFDFAPDVLSALSFRADVPDFPHECIRLRDVAIVDAEAKRAAMR